MESAETSLQDDEIIDLIEQENFKQELHALSRTEQLKRSCEIRSAVGIAIFVISCVWLQLLRYDIKSWMFVIIFYINALLIVAVLILVARNVIKLMIERRNHVFGAKLRTRMVVIFVLLTVIPTGLLFIVANRVITTGLDIVFAIQTQPSLVGTPDVREIKISMRLILAFLSMFTLFSSIWYGFRLSKEFTAPILALSDGTARIAKGELGITLEDAGNDEISQLVASFNKMAADLRENRAQLTSANRTLAFHNIAMDERRRYIETVLNNITTGVITLDSAGRLQTINSAACSTFHITADFLYGRRPENFLPPLYTEDYFDMMEFLRENPQSRWSRQIDFTIKGITLKLAITAVALQNDKGMVATFIIVIEDVTEIEKMQQMAAWREVARRIAHEIKNPLTPIKLSAQRMQRKFPQLANDPVFMQCTDLIISQTERIQTMVSEFSAFAKLPETNIILDDLPPIIDELSAVFVSVHPMITWRVRIPKDLPKILMDKDAIYRALLNLVNNAADAVDDNVDASVRDHNKNVTLTVQLIDSNRYVKISVQDTGMGLTPDERNRLFEPYFSRKKGGTGLGLAIVKSIISDHHGDIFVESSIKGTTISVTIPTIIYSRTTSIDNLSIAE